MSYNVSNVYNNLYNNQYTNTNSNTLGSNNNFMETISGLLNNENGSSSSSDLLTGMMIGLMCSGVTGSGSSNMLGGSESSSANSGFSVMLSSLLNAMNEKNQQVKQGLIQNSQGSSNTNISDIIFRPSGNASNIDTSNLPQSERIEAAIKNASATHGISEDLIRAIIKVESNFDPQAVSSAGAMGLMQLMPCNVEEYKVNNPFNIEENINAGTQHIKDYLKMYNNDLNMALAAYNFGPGNMASRGITSSKDFYKLPTETKNYLVKVNGLL